MTLKVDVSKSNVYDMESVKASNVKGTGKKIVEAISSNARAEAANKIISDAKLNSRALEAQRKGASTALKNIVDIDVKLTDFSDKKSIESAAKLGESLFNACIVDAKNESQYKKLGYEPAIAEITESAIVDVIETLNGKQADVTMDCVSAIMDAAIKHKMPKVEMEISQKAGFKGFVENVGNSFKYAIENVKRFFQGVFAALFKSGKMATSNVINKILDKIDTIEDKNVKNCALSALAKYTDKKEVCEKIISKIHVPVSDEERYAYESACFSVLNNKHVNEVDNASLVKFIDTTSKNAHSYSVLGLIAKNDNSSSGALDNVIQNGNDKLPEEILADVAKHDNSSAETLLAVVKYRRPAFVADDKGYVTERPNSKICKDTLKLVVLNDNVDSNVLIAAVAHDNVDAKCLKLVALSEKANSECMEQVANHKDTDLGTLMIVAKDEKSTTKALSNIIKTHAEKVTEKLLVEIIKNNHIDRNVLKSVLKNSKVGHSAVVSAINNCNKLLEDNKDIYDALKVKISDLRSFDKLKLRADLHDIIVESLAKQSSKRLADVTDLTQKLLNYTGMLSKEQSATMQNNDAEIQMQIDSLSKKVDGPIAENSQILVAAIDVQQQKGVVEATPVQAKPSEHVEPRQSSVVSNQSIHDDELSMSALNVSNVSTSGVKPKSPQTLKAMITKEEGKLKELKKPLGILKGEAKAKREAEIAAVTKRISDLSSDLSKSQSSK